ncbi:MAG: hypothetical protein ABSE51_07065 [Terracidiphilus sp.]|jgi:hypothetical protein
MDHNADSENATNQKEQQGPAEGISSPVPEKVGEQGRPSHAGKNGGSHNRGRKNWFSDLWHEGPDRQLELILAAVITVVSFCQLLVTIVNNRSTSAQVDKIIDASNGIRDAASQIEQSSWRFSESAQGINNAGWDAVTKLDAQAQEIKKAAASAATTARESLHVSQRAYVVAKLPESGNGLGPCPTPTKDAVYCSSIGFANIGNTPAIALVVRGKLALKFKGKTPLDSFPIPSYDGQTGIALSHGVEQSESIKMTEDISRWMGTKSLMQDQNGGYYLFGYIQYQDIFEGYHITAFCNYYPLNPNPQDHAPSQCITGNWLEHPPRQKRKTKNMP